MKRKYPISFFLIGILLNFIKYGIVLAAALLFIIIGLMRGGFCKILGFSLLAVYFTVCIVSQLYVMSGGCGHFLGLVMQPSQGSVGTPKDSYFQVMF